MKLLALIAGILGFGFVWAGCSEKEPETSPAQQPLALRFTIQRPIPKAIETPLEAPRPYFPPQIVKKIEIPKKTPPPLSPKPNIPAKLPASPLLKTEKGYYFVKRGENLLTIAAHQSVYGDPLKWTALLHHNFGQLVYMPPQKGFAEQELPKGIKLKILTPADIKENGEKRRPYAWVVNVASLNASKPLDPLAYKLIQKGYCVYISRANVKGADWYRLRVGFFQDQTSAKTAMAEIMTIVKFDDMWLIKINPTEFNEYAGLFKAS